MVARKLEKYLTRQFEHHVSRDSVEREQKYRIARVDTIRKRLLKLGAQVHASGLSGTNYMTAMTVSAVRT